MKLNPYRPHRAARVFAVFCLVSLLVPSALANNPIPQVVGPPVPQAVVPGRGAFTLKVYGANFVEGAVVNWNRQPRTTTFVSARELHAQILASDVAKPTAGYITVTNPPPGGGVSSSSYAIVEVHQPTETLVPGTTSEYGKEQKGQVWSLAAADFNNDGILDLVWGDGLGNVFAYLGNRDGSFRYGSLVSKSYFFGSNLVFGDFNGDGHLDLGFTGGINPLYRYHISLGEGNGRFRRGSPFGHNAAGCACVAGDFNGDGALDLIINLGGSEYLFLGNGDGTFDRASKQPVYSAGFAAVAGDFNGDGKLDLVVEVETNGGHNAALYFIAGNGDGTFQKPQWIHAISRGCTTGVLASDFNGDGKLDLVFCDGERIGILLGKGDGTFGHPRYYSAYVNFTVGDFNSDGKTDVFASGSNLLFLGKGDGTFQQPIKINFSDYGELGIVTGDFNADGLLDLIFQDGGWGLTVHIQK